MESLWDTLDVYEPEDSTLVDSALENTPLDDTPLVATSLEATPAEVAPLEVTPAEVAPPAAAPLEVAPPAVTPVRAPLLVTTSSAMPVQVIATPVSRGVRTTISVSLRMAQPQSLIRRPIAKDLLRRATLPYQVDRINLDASALLAWTGIAQHYRARMHIDELGGAICILARVYAWCRLTDNPATATISRILMTWQQKRSEYTSIHISETMRVQIRECSTILRSLF